MVGSSAESRRQPESIDLGRRAFVAKSDFAVASRLVLQATVLQTTVLQAIAKFAS
jgi:hypothetical protein